MLVVLTLEVLILGMTPFDNINHTIQRICIIIISIVTWEVIKKINGTLNKK